MDDASSNQESQGNSARPLMLVIIIAMVAVLTFLLTQRSTGEPAIRPADGVVTDPLLAPQLSSLADAVDADPDDVDRRSSLGYGYESNELYEPALATWRQLLAMEPESWVWPYRMGMTFERMGDLDAAIDSMSASVKRSPPKTVDPWWRLATWLIDAGRLEEAEPVLIEAVERDGEALPVRVAQVKLALARTKGAEAEDMILRFRLTSSLPGGYGWNLLAQAIRQQGRLEEAGKVASRASDVRPRFSDVFSQQASGAVGGLRSLKLAAVAQAEAGKWRDVIQTISRVLRHEPDDPSSRRLHAIARFRTGDAASAEKEIMSLIEDSPEASLWSTLGSIRLQLFRDQGDVSLAEAALDAVKQGLALAPDDRLLLTVQGRVQGMLGNPAGAYESLRLAWDQDRSRTEILKVAMVAINEADLWAEAIEMSAALHAVEPGDPMAGAGYALGLARLGRIEEARSILKGLNGRRIHAGLRQQAQALVEQESTDAN